MDNTQNDIKHFGERYEPMAGLRVGMGGAAVVELSVVTSVGRRVATVIVVPVLMVVMEVGVVVDEAVVLPLVVSVE